jgi:hypothetical protein
MSRRSPSPRLAASLLVAAALAAAVCLGAAAAAAPTAFTGPVSAVASTSATVTGTVNPEGTATTWSFEYGTTSSYGSQTAAQSAGSGTTSTAVTANLSGLSPGTTYHYRLDATSSAGPAQGSDGIFTTPSAPGALTAAATNLTATAATLNGTVDPNGQSTTYFFQYGTSTSYGSSTPTASAGSGTAAINVAATVSGLQASQTYHFRLVATSGAGTTDGPDMSLRLSAPPTVTTSAPTSVTATTARLNGTVNPNGQPTTWQFEYGPTTSYGSATAGQSVGSGTGPVNVSASVSGLSATSIYHFRLVATNASGTSYGSDQTIGNAVPPLVETGSAEGAGPTSVTLTGSVDPKGSATTWYFEYGTTTSYGTSSPTGSAISGTGARAVTASISMLAPATTYHYRIVASSSAGTSNGGDVTFTTPPAVTLIAESSQSVYGRTVTLSGAAAGTPAGSTVTVLAEPLGTTSFATLTTVATQAGGAWSYQARPKIATSYEASTTLGTSTPVTIGVRPAITLRLITGARFLIRVVAPTSLAGRTVQFQRLLPRGGWATVARGRLNGSSSVVIAAKSLPLGSSTIRVAMSINQAGRGYLAGFSRTIVFARKP